MTIKQSKALSGLSSRDRDSVRERLLHLRANGISRELRELALEWGVGEELLKQIEGEPQYVESIIRKLNTKYVSDGVLCQLYDKLKQLALEDGSVSAAKELIRLMEKKQEVYIEKPKQEVPIDGRGNIDEDAIALRVKEITP